MSTVNINFGDDAGAKLRSALPYDIVKIAKGSYTISGEVTIADHVQVICAGLPWEADLTFTTGTDKFAFRLSGSGHTFKDLSIHANNGIFRTDNLNGTKIIGNRLQWGYNGTYYNRLAVLCYGHADGFILESNLFIDSDKSDRNLEVWGWANGSYSFNEFYNVIDGGHVMNPGDNLKIEGNVGEQVHRMPGGEYQQNGYPPSPWPKNHRFANNVFYNPKLPYWDSMGVSYPLAVDGIVIEGNYWDMRPSNGVYGVADSSGSQRGSYIIEGPQAPAGKEAGLIQNNIGISGRSVAFVSAPGKNTPVKNNKLFGDFAWYSGTGSGGEPGALGGGNVVESGNTWDKNVANAPPPPRRVTKQPYGQSSAPPPPPPPPTMPQITAPIIDRLEIGKTYVATGTGIGALKWFIDRLGDGKDAFATGDGPSISFTVPPSFQNIDTTEQHKIEIALLDSSNARATKTYAIVKPIVQPPPADKFTVLTGVPYNVKVPETNGVPDFTKATKV